MRLCEISEIGLRPRDVAADGGIPDDDREHLASYVENEIGGLHEGNAIRYRLTAEEIALIGPPGTDTAG